MLLSCVRRTAQIIPKIAIPIETQHQPRARGKVNVSSKRVGKRSVIDQLHQSGSSKCLFPRAASEGLDAVLLNTAGGVTGGDCFAATATAGTDTALTLTTQACERAYRAQPDQVGVIRNRLAVGARARLAWLPQETILFEGAALDRCLQIDIDPSGTLLMAEPLVLGRTEMGETLRHLRFRDRIDIRRAGKPLFLDAVSLLGDAQRHLAKRFIAGGAAAMALVVYVGADAAGQLDPVRDQLPPTGGASLIQPDVLVARLLAADSFVLRQHLIPILRRLNGDMLPRCWMI